MTPTHSTAALGRGVAWIGGVRWAAQVVSWGSTLFVVRLLRPEDYGIVGMAATYIQLAQVLTEFGVGTAVMARADMDAEEIAQANTFTFLLGIVGVLFSVAVAVPLARFFGEPRVTGVVLALSPLCLFGALSAVPNAVLMRDHRYRDSAVVDLLRSVFGSVAVIGLALLGFGYWALIGGQLLGALLPLIVLLARYPQPFHRIERTGIAPLITFSRELLVGRLAWMAYQSAPLAIVGRVLGTAALGQYSFAWTLATLPGEKLSSVVSSVLPSVLRTARGDPTVLWRYMRTSLEVLSIIMIPALVGLMLTAHDLVDVVFGVKWIEAVPPLIILSAYALLQWFLPLLNQVLVVSGDVAFQRRMGLWMVSIIIPAFYIGARWGGLLGLCAAWIVCWPINAVPLIRLATKRMGKAPVDLWRTMSAGAAGAALSVVIVVSVRLLGYRFGYGPKFVLMVAIPFSIIGHALLVLHLRPGVKSRILAMLRGSAIEPSPSTN